MRDKIKILFCLMITLFVSASSPKTPKKCSSPKTWKSPYIAYHQNKDLERQKILTKQALALKLQNEEIARRRQESRANLHGFSSFEVMKNTQATSQERLPRTMSAVIRSVENTMARRASFKQKQQKPKTTASETVTSSFVLTEQARKSAVKQTLELLKSNPLRQK